jgi:hypothetical protein
MHGRVKTKKTIGDERNHQMLYTTEEPYKIYCVFANSLMTLILSFEFSYIAARKSRPSCSGSVVAAAAKVNKSVNTLGLKCILACDERWKVKEPKYVQGTIRLDSCVSGGGVVDGYNKKKPRQQEKICRRVFSSKEHQDCDTRDKSSFRPPAKPGSFQSFILACFFLLSFFLPGFCPFRILRLNFLYFWWTWKEILNGTTHGPLILSAYSRYDVIHPCLWSLQGSSSDILPMMDQRDHWSSFEWISIEMKLIGHDSDALCDSRNPSRLKILDIF